MENDEMMERLDIEEAETLDDVTEAEVDDEEEKAKETIKRVYLGPSIPRVGLRSGMILSGEKQALDAYIKVLCEKYPMIRHLMAEPERVAEMMDKVRDKKSVLHRYCKETAERAGKRGE